MPCFLNIPVTKKRWPCRPFNNRVFLAQSPSQNPEIAVRVQHRVQVGSLQALQRYGEGALRGSIAQILWVDLASKKRRTQAKPWRAILALQNALKQHLCELERESILRQLSWALWRKTSLVCARQSAAGKSSSCPGSLYSKLQGCVGDLDDGPGHLRTLTSWSQILTRAIQPPPKVRPKQAPDNH